MLRLALFLTLCSSAVAFAPSGLGLPSCRSTSRSSCVNIRMGKSMEEKEVIIEKVRDRLESAQFIFSTPLKGINMPQINQLRSSLPEGSSAMVIKNRLLKRAAKGSEWVEAGNLANESNLWIIIDEDIKESMSAFKAWGKATKLGDVNGGVLEGRMYDSKGVMAIGDLPSKSELYAQIAGSINAVPAKLASVMKEIPQKTARAVKLATMPDA